MTIAHWIHNRSLRTKATVAVLVIIFLALSASVTATIVQTNRNYQWFSGYSGTTIASLSVEEEGVLGDTIAVVGSGSGRGGSL